MESLNHDRYGEAPLLLETIRVLRSIAPTTFSITIENDGNPSSSGPSLTTEPLVDWPLLN
jgi:hypothetical protein